MNTKITCECGSSYTENTKAKHLETKKHKTFFKIEIISIKCDICGGSYTEGKQAKHNDTKKHKQALGIEIEGIVINCICGEQFIEGTASTHHETTRHKNFMHKMPVEDVPEKIVEKKVTEKIKCECGAEISKSSMTIHLKSKKHAEALEKIKI
jgi:hypothetical protein